MLYYCAERSFAACFLDGCKTPENKVVQNTCGVSITSVILKDHDAVSVGVAIELSGYDVAVVSEDLHQLFVVDFAHGGGVEGVRQVTNWNVSDDVDLPQNRQRTGVFWGVWSE